MESVGWFLPMQSQSENTGNTSLCHPMSGDTSNNVKDIINLCTINSLFHNACDEAKMLVLFSRCLRMSSPRTTRWTS